MLDDISLRLERNMRPNSMLCLIMLENEENWKLRPDIAGAIMKTWVAVKKR